MQPNLLEDAGQNVDINPRDSRQVRNDIDSLNEIRESLQSEVKNLQSCLGEKEAENKNLQEIKERYENSIKSLESQVKLLL